MTLRICDGDLLDQDVEVIVNAWNRNIIPWWLLLPQGVSGPLNAGPDMSRSASWPVTGPTALSFFWPIR